jgi:DNA-binding MarR family transcriptional regulator
LKGLTESWIKKVENSDIPDQVRNFIFEYIESLAQLDVLLFLFNNQKHSFNAFDIAREMRTNPDSVSVSLIQLAQYGFLLLENSDKNTYVYNQTNKDDGCIRKVDNAYRNYRHLLITLIFSKPV